MSNELVDPVALGITAAGVIIAGAVWLLTRSHTPALPILADMLMAAGLLRLTADQSWQAIGAAALIVVIRKVVVAGIGRAAVVRRSAATPLQ